jgi:hypothetical protein
VVPFKPYAEHRQWVEKKNHFYRRRNFVETVTSRIASPKPRSGRQFWSKAPPIITASLLLWNSGTMLKKFRRKHENGSNQNRVPSAVFGG